MPVFGDGGARRDYTYVDDIADGVLRALDRSRGFAILNLGGSRATSLSELVALLAEALGHPAAIERLPEQRGDVPVTLADTARAREALGWEPRVPLEEGLRRFAERLRAPVPARP